MEFELVKSMAFQESLVKVASQLFGSSKQSADSGGNEINTAADAAQVMKRWG